MSSGFGNNGGVSRCFYFYQDFASCMKNDETPLANCGVLRDDYLECLHNRKAAQRLHELRQQAEINKKGGAAAGSGGHGGGHH